VSAARWARGRAVDCTGRQRHLHPVLGLRRRPGREPGGPAARRAE